LNYSVFHDANQIQFKFNGVAPFCHSVMINFKKSSLETLEFSSSPTNGLCVKCKDADR
jgi:hypothetical protein